MFVARRTTLAVAAKLGQAVAQDDLIIVSPWFNGISFARYYRGPATWVSIPAIDFFKFHRYDLIKEKMIMPNQAEPIRTVLDQISSTLKGGHRVWFAGLMNLPKPGEQPFTLPPAPEANSGWHDEPYLLMWSGKVAAYLQACASRMKDVPIPTNEPVSEFENLPLKVFEGWSGL